MIKTFLKLLSRPTIGNKDGCIVSFFEQQYTTLPSGIPHFLF